MGHVSYHRCFTLGAYLVVLCFSCSLTRHGSEQRILLDCGFTSLFSGIHSLPHLPALLLSLGLGTKGPQVSQIHIAKVTRTYAASPSFNPFPSIKCDLMYQSHSSNLLSPASLFCLSHVATAHLPSPCVVCHC